MFGISIAQIITQIITAHYLKQKIMKKSFLLLLVLTALFLMSCQNMIV